MKITKVEIKFAYSEQANTFVKWCDGSDCFAEYGIMVAQRPNMSRYVIGVFHSRVKAYAFSFWFANAGGFDKYRAFLFEGELIGEMLMPGIVESVGTNEKEIRISIR